MKYKIQKMASKKIIVCCYCYGNSFIKSLEVYGLKSFYESTRITNKDENLEIIYHFYTYKRYLSKLKKVVSAFPINFLIHDINKIGISEKIWEVSIWNTCLKTYVSDYFFLLIPDNFYYKNYFSTIFNSLDDNDIFVGLPPYICKESFEEEYKFDFLRIQNTEFYKIFESHAHPFNYSLVVNNPDLYPYASLEQELMILTDNKFVDITIQTAHPVALSFLRFSPDHLNFQTRLNNNVFKISYLKSFLSFSIDFFYNKLRLVKKKKKLNFFANILLFLTPYLNHPWESGKFFNYSISLKKNKLNKDSLRLDLFQIIKDKKFLEYIAFREFSPNTLDDVYRTYDDFLQTLKKKGPYSFKNQDSNASKISSSYLQHFCRKIETIKKLALMLSDKSNNNYLLTYSYKEIQNMRFGIKSRKIFEKKDITKI